MYTVPRGNTEIPRKVCVRWVFPIFQVWAFPLFSPQGGDTSISVPLGDRVSDKSSLHLGGEGRYRVPRGGMNTFFSPRQRET